ncbi:unnamed protein product [Pieris brassicae]|uniref:Uncharacterized protein n=1 Tax=Pieris brassicae TaxID=7116 RepID=A0A9P0T7T9_PIEBR|nr:unnamed protein product [Pieris brassicae]
MIARGLSGALSVRQRKGPIRRYSGDWMMIRGGAPTSGGGPVPLPPDMFPPCMAAPIVEAAGGEGEMAPEVSDIEMEAILTRLNNGSIVRYCECLQ